MKFDPVSLKVCFIVGTLGQGGAERQLFYMLKALRQNNIVVRVLCLTRGEFWEDKVLDLGVPVTWIGQRKSKIGRLARAIEELRRDLPNVIQSQHFYTNLYTLAAARMLGIREVGAIRSNGYKDVEGGNALARRLSLRLLRITAANSHAAVHAAISFGVPAARLFLLPNVVDTNQFLPTRRRADGAVTLIAAGRMAEEKRFDRFLSIVSRVRNHTSGTVKAVVIGSGPQRPQLEAQAGALGLLPGGVEFLGPVADMAPIYEAADIFVLTSDWEGTPNVVLEAMSSGLPIVGTRVGDLKEIVRHGEAGYLAEPGDEDSLVDAVCGLVANLELRLQMGRRARAYVEANHALDRLPALLEALYRAALS